MQAVQEPDITYPTAASVAMYTHCFGEVLGATPLPAPFPESPAAHGRVAALW
jgi:hypothetical protein